VWCGPLRRSHHSGESLLARARHTGLQTHHRPQSDLPPARGVPGANYSILSYFEIATTSTLSRLDLKGIATAPIGSVGERGGNTTRTFSRRPNVTGVTGQFAKAG